MEKKRGKKNLEIVYSTICEQINNEPLKPSYIYSPPLNIQHMHGSNIWKLRSI